ncbi:MAG: hypothetical protein SGPRY_008678, partial [Prymnesium sp.]
AGTRGTRFAARASPSTSFAKSHSPSSPLGCATRGTCTSTSTTAGWRRAGGRMGIYQHTQNGFPAE